MSIIWKKEATSAKITHVHIFLAPPCKTCPPKIARIQFTLNLYDNKGNLIHRPIYDGLDDFSDQEKADVYALLQSKLTACVDGLNTQEEVLYE